jgi:hypothetical protein
VLVADTVSHHFQSAPATRVMRDDGIQQLNRSGFTTMPGPLSAARFQQVVAAYDAIMASASVPDY